MTFPPSVSQFHFNEEVCQFVRFCFFLALLFRFFSFLFRCFDFLLTFFICSFFFDLCFRCFFLVEPVVFYSLLCFSFFCLVDCTATCECVSSHFPLSPWMVGIDALKDVFKGKEGKYGKKTAEWGHISNNGQETLQWSPDNWLHSAFGRICTMWIHVIYAVNLRIIFVWWAVRANQSTFFTGRCDWWNRFPEWMRCAEARPEIRKEQPFCPTLASVVWLPFVASWAFAAHLHPNAFNWMNGTVFVLELCLFADLHLRFLMSGMSGRRSHAFSA